MNKNIGKLTEYIIKRRQQRDDELKYDFMPSLLEIIERPAHIASKVIIIAISVMLLFAIVYSACAKIDIVVSGSGKITGEKEDISVAFGYSGNIVELNANTGDYVRKGDVLVKLNTSEIESNKELAEEELEKTKIEKEIALTFLDDINAKIDISKYDSKYEQQIELLILENELYKQQLKSITYDKDKYLLQKEISEKQRIAQLDVAIKKYEAVIKQYEQQIKEMMLVAPLDGYVSTMKISNVGEFVSAQEKLITITPKDSDYIFEGYLSDKDISSVEVGDIVQIKLSAYSFSDYGAVKGKIKDISKNTKFVEGIGNVYVIKIEIDSELNENIILKYGLSGSMEIIVGKRSLLDYFAEPIKKGLDSSLKEE